MKHLRPPVGLRDDRVREAAVLLLLAGLTTALFSWLPIDITVARFFFRASDAGHWPLAQLWPWSWSNRLAPFVTISLLTLGFFALLLGRFGKLEFWRVSGIFVLLTVLLGPGLIINPIFKDHWDRPRPRDVVEFGGALQYQPAPLLGDGGDSFPCDQCSAGFLLAGGWWLWKRQRPARARAFLALGLATGLALGLGGMAQGEHFLSDVLWSALLALGLAHVVYHYVLRLPSRDLLAGAPLPGRRTMIVLLILAAAARLPHGEHFETRVNESRLARAPQVLEVSARDANIEIVVGDFPKTQMLLAGELHGFGLPANRLEAATAFRADPIPTLSYRIEQEGWLIDRDASVSFRIPPGALSRVVVRLEHGNIRVIDTTSERLVTNGRLRLDLRTRAGDVKQPLVSPQAIRVSSVIGAQ